MTVTMMRNDRENAPIIALHSSASNGGQWNRLSSDVEGRFRVHAPNLPGYGANALTPEQSAGGLAAAAMPAIAEILAVQQPVHLLGHSNGAGIALKVAMLRPDLIKSLTLYEPAVFHLLRDGSPNDRCLFAGIEGIYRTLAAGSASGNPEPGMQAFLDFWNGAGTWSRLPDRQRQKYKRLSSQVVTDFERAFAEDWGPDRLQALDMPTLLLMGLDSPEIAQRTSTLVHAAVPRADLALLPGLGHMAPVTDPEWVNLRIIHHIAKTERAAQACRWSLQSAA